MTVKEVIDNLQKMNPDAQLVAYDADTSAPAPVTGFLYDGFFVEIQTDDPE